MFIVAAFAAAATNDSEDRHSRTNRRGMHFLPFFNGTFDDSAAACCRHGHQNVIVWL